jgi:ABC-type uncharacterized transport system fused permease/ATPase subunit
MVFDPHDHHTETETAASLGVEGMTRLLPSLPTRTQPNDDDERTDGFRLQLVVRRFGIFCKLAFPYFCQSLHGRFLLIAVLALTLFQSGVSVAISYLNKDFMNALVSRAVTEFYVILLKYLAAFAIGAPATVLYNFLRAQLAVHWREWMTSRTLGLYFADRVYYKLERKNCSDYIDNPDQRITEDIKSFTSFSLELGISCLTSFIDLVSFSIVLWSIYPVSLLLQFLRNSSPED